MSTRHRGVLELTDAVDVCDMRNASNFSVVDVIRASTTAVPKIKTRTISTLSKE